MGNFPCPGCKAPWHSADDACPCDCSVKYPGLPQGGADPEYIWDQLHDVTHDTSNYAIQDSLKVPTNIPAGEYVLGWRWDCEATSQIWSSCADITIVESDSLVVYASICLRVF